MSKLICKTCQKPKASFHCGVCNDSICKSCAQFVGEDAFSFEKKVDPKLRYPTYCTSCFDENVAAPLAEYNDNMEKAKDIIIYTKEQTKLTRGLSRQEEPYKVENCEDDDEAVMRMAFFAVKAGFNCLIDIQFSTKKIIIGSHKKTMHSATAVPITIDPDSIRGHMDPP